MQRRLDDAKESGLPELQGKLAIGLRREHAVAARGRAQERSAMLARAAVEADRVAIASDLLQMRRAVLQGRQDLDVTMGTLVDGVAGAGAETFARGAMNLGAAEEEAEEVADKVAEEAAEEAARAEAAQWLVASVVQRAETEAKAEAKEATQLQAVMQVVTEGAVHEVVAEEAMVAEALTLLSPRSVDESISDYSEIERQLGQTDYSEQAQPVPRLVGSAQFSPERAIATLAPFDAAQLVRLA